VRIIELVKFSIREHIKPAILYLRYELKDQKLVIRNLSLTEGVKENNICFSMKTVFGDIVFILNAAIRRFNRNTTG